MSALSTIVNSSSSPKAKQPSVLPTSSTSNGTSATQTVPTSDSVNPSNSNGTSTNNKSTPAVITADDVKYKRKYKDLKKRIRDIEEDNDILNLKLSRARKNIHRLRVERRLDQSEHGTTHPSTSSSSTSDPDTDEERNNNGSRSHRHHHHRHGLDRHKHHRHPYSHHSSNSHHSRHGSSQSHAPQANASTMNQARSNSPPSRASSVTGSVQHSASSSLGSTSIMDSSQAVSPSTSGGKRVTKKRRKDPLAPKRPSNAFFIFSQQHRQQAREEKKEGNQSELTKFLGQQWKSMPSNEKKIYSELAIQDRQRYMEEMTQYQHEHGHGPYGLDDITHKKKPGKPGRPPKSTKANEEPIAEPLPKSTAETNGHTSVKSKMEIQLMVNGDTEGDELTSHDEDDVRGGATEDEHYDGEEEEEEVSHDHEDEEHGEDEEDHRMDHDHHGHNVSDRDLDVPRHYGGDVEMAEAHRSQSMAGANGVIVSA
ncbi:hypothetical protein BGZ51_007617 [Haplosporangium sp. Z 767]|nr:hypothetical protein BGZ51_007617 [Haplosporangium sp. Z 767]KAF9193500.1 hypothetical protein BGZ50_007430 [Haplosporangium sp. Z 11]